MSWDKGSGRESGRVCVGRSRRGGGRALRGPRRRRRGTRTLRKAAGKGGGGAEVAWDGGGECAERPEATRRLRVCVGARAQRAGGRVVVRARLEELPRSRLDLERQLVDPREPDLSTGGEGVDADVEVGDEEEGDGGRHDWRRRDHLQPRRRPRRHSSAQARAPAPAPLRGWRLCLVCVCVQRPATQRRADGGFAGAPSWATKACTSRTSAGMPILSRHRTHLRYGLCTQSRTGPSSRRCRSSRRGTGTTSSGTTAAPRRRPRRPL